LLKVTAVEAFLVGIVGTLIAVYVSRAHGHNAFLVIVFFVALIFFGCNAVLEPASTSLHLLSMAIGLTALGVLFETTEE
jgi:hypothetical protein